MPSAKKKPSTSKKIKRPRGRPKEALPLPGIAEKFYRQYPMQDPKREFRAPEMSDYEEGRGTHPDDVGMKYPPPKLHPVFRAKWKMFIDNVTSRENFKVGHLSALEILCDMFVEYEDLQKFIRTKGRVYYSTGRQGEQWKFYPEVGQLNRVTAQIKEYMKMLGLLLKKDHAVDNPSGEKDEWA